jgi:hypothetical protein
MLGLVERERPAVLRQSVGAKRRELDRRIDPVEQRSTETDAEGGEHAFERLRSPADGAASSRKVARRP